MIKLNLGYVVLPVDGKLLDDVRRWYETQLGLDHVLEDDDRYMLAGKNGFAVEFRKGTPLRNPERVVLAFSTDDADVIFNRMRETRLLEFGPKQTDRGLRVLRLRDPAGHTVEVFEVDLEHEAEGLTNKRRES